VRARHPQFYIECDELVVEMRREEEPEKSEKSGKPGKPAADVITAEAGEAQDGGIKRAVATGNTVTIEKRNLEGEVQMGKCRKAVYDGGTGAITMSQYPQVQRGNILHMATQPDTLMVFDRDGRLRTTGRPRTIILGEENGRLEADGPPPGGAR
jgi:lipopolysaccharide export system protein LptA